MCVKKNSSKDLIIDTAARLFFSQGYHATGLNQILKESQAPKGSLYHYFPQGKEELAHECIHQTNLHIKSRFEEFFAKYDNTADAIQAFIRSMADEAESNGYTGFMPFSLWAAVETACVSPRLREASQAVFVDWQDIISESLHRDGFSDQQAEEIALLIISLMEGALIISLTRQDKTPLLTAAEFLVKVARKAEHGA
ncbi:putative HTH-type transcriptional regulator YxaF [compost metagenome]